MQGDPDVLKLLNEQLTSELTAINQYFLHGKMQENWGFTELASHTRAESFDEMRHAEAITDTAPPADGFSREIIRIHPEWVRSLGLPPAGG